MHDLIANGKRVVLGATPSGNRLMFKLSSLCGGWADIPRGSPSQSATSFWGQRMRTGKIVRAYRSALHYTVFSENELGGDVLYGTEQEPDEVNAKTLAKFVRAGVNILAPDGLDGATIEAMVWSWAPKEPQADAVAAVISASDGRWYGVRDATGVAHAACVSRAGNAVVWRVIGREQSCPTTFAPGSPRSGLENELLRQTLASSVGGSAVALLDLDLANFPSISALDAALFDGNATVVVVPIAETEAPTPVHTLPPPGHSAAEAAWSRYTPQELFAMIQGIFESLNEPNGA
ncbi:hypothetical protein ATCC90586_007875 [Pythium insidiosum]|nr:hypothetical protein ATCC90586_007875 [Pythium insidiosum]